MLSPVLDTVIFKLKSVNFYLLNYSTE